MKNFQGAVAGHFLWLPKGWEISEFSSARVERPAEHSRRDPRKSCVNSTSNPAVIILLLGLFG